MEFFIALLVFLIILAALIYYLLVKEKKITEAYKNMSEKTGLAYRPMNFLFFPKHKLLGSIDGFEIEIYEEVFGRWTDNSETITRIKIYHQLKIPAFIIKEETFFTQIGKKMGMPDIQIENDPLDDKFIFRCQDIQYFKTLMNDDVQLKLSGIMNSFKGEIYKEGQNVYCDFPSRIESNISINNILKNLEFTLYFLIRAKEI